MPDELTRFTSPMACGASIVLLLAAGGCFGRTTPRVEEGPWTAARPIELIGLPGTHPIEALATEPDLRLRDLAGSVHDIPAALERGETVALFFWQSWCGTCLEAAEAVRRYAHSGPAALHVIGIVPGPDAYVRDADVIEVIRRLELPFAVVRDRDLALSRHFEVAATPVFVLLGPLGDVVYRGSAPPPWETALAP